MCKCRPNTEKASPEICARSNPQKTRNQIEKKHRPGKEKNKNPTIQNNNALDQTEDPQTLILYFTSVSTAVRATKGAFTLGVKGL
jgi:hypothetical protein